MKPIPFVLNDRWTIKTGGTNLALIKACAQRGNPVFATDVVHLQASSSVNVFADSIQLLPAYAFTDLVNHNDSRHQ
jgi:hypothetical protein